MTRSMVEYVTTAANPPNRPQTAQHWSQLSKVLNDVLPRTADTGQTSNAILLTNQSSSAYGSGYEIFAFTDTLQATKPVYVRVDWTLSSGSVSFSVGTATNGAGVLTTTAGQASTALGAFVATEGNKRTALAWSDGSSLSFFYNIQNSSQTTLQDNLAGFIVERTRDGDGTPNGNGIMIWRWASTGEVGVNATTTYAQGISRIFDPAAINNQPGADYGVNAYVPGQANVSTTVPNQTVGGVYAYPVYGYAGALAQGASKALAVGYAIDLPRMAPITLNHYGQNTTWLPLGQVLYAPYLSATAAAASRLNLCPVIRWE